MKKNLFALAALALLAACSGGSSGTDKPPTEPPPPPPVVARVAVTADSAALTAGGTLQMRAQALTASDAEVPGQTFTWRSSSDALATVDATGRVTAVAPGSVAISATVGTVAGSMTLTVRPLPVAAVAVVPAVDSLVAGTQRQLVAETRTAGGIVISGRTVTWTSSDPAILAVSAGGLAEARMPGTVQVTATSEGRSGQATIKVKPRPVASLTPRYGYAVVLAGRQLALEATAVDAAGQAVPAAELRWTTSDPAVATVDAAGRLLGVAVGTARITVAVGTVTAPVDVVVYPALAAGQGIVQVSASVPTRGGQKTPTARMMYALDGPALLAPRGRLAGREDGGSRFTSSVVQIPAPAGTYSVRGVSQDYRFPLERVVGGSAILPGVALAAGEVREVALTLAVPQLVLNGPATATGGQQVTFSWTVTAPGLSGRASTEAGLILEEQNTSSSRHPFGGTQARTTATHAGGVFQSSHTFASSQTPAVFKVRAYATGTDWTHERPGSAGSIAIDWHAFGALEGGERLLETK